MQRTLGIREFLALNDELHIGLPGSLRHRQNIDPFTGQGLRPLGQDPRLTDIGTDGADDSHRPTRHILEQIAQFSNQVR